MQKILQDVENQATMALFPAFPNQYRGVNPQACLDVLEPFKAMGWEAGSMPFISMYQRCSFTLPGNGTFKATESEMWAWLQPWKSRFIQVQREQRGPHALTAEMVMDIHALNFAMHAGLVIDAEHRFVFSLKRRIEQVTSSPPDAIALEELMFYARTRAGRWQQQDHHKRMHAVVAQGLGESHLASLWMLRALAYHERFMGRNDVALEFIARAGGLARQHHGENAELQAHMASEWAACLSAVGRLSEALQKNLEARDFFESQVPIPWVSVTRVSYNMAELALDMGDFDAAIVHAERSLEFIRRSDHDYLKKAEFVIPAAVLALAQMAQGNASSAQRLKSALTVGADDMHVGDKAFGLLRFALQRGDAEMVNWAADFTERHIKLFRAPLQADSALRPLIQAWRKAGMNLQSPEVGEPLERSLAIGLGGRNPNILATTQFSMARHLSTVQPATSVWLYKRAANLLQQMRQGLGADNQDNYRNWLSTYEDELRVFVALLIDEGRLPEAEQVLSLVREEELYEYNRRSAKKRTGDLQALSFTPAEQAANPALEALARDAEVHAHAADARLDAALRAELRANYQDPQAEQDTSAIAQRLHAVLATALPGRTAVNTHASTANSQAQTQTQAQNLPAHTARLTYVVGPQGVDILMATRQGTSRQRVNLLPATLNQHIQSARSALSNPQTQARDALHSLWSTLVQPVHARLKKEAITRLIVVPDGALRYLPFATLFDGKRYLVQQFEVQTQWYGTTAASHTTTTSETTAVRTAVRTAVQPALHVLALGRTVGDAQHSALPGVARELQAVPQRHNQILLDEAFTADSLLQGLQRHPAIVHVASHFVLDPGGEDKSYLLLGNGQRLSLTQLKQLPWAGVQLALLSACNSAVALNATNTTTTNNNTTTTPTGSPRSDGREWMGFANTLAQAGVRDVMATLWRIDDDHTASWMSGFYAQLAKGKGRQASSQPSAATLAQAQRQWLHTHRTSNLAHPHYWASFVWLQS